MATTAVDVVVPAHGAVFVGSGSPTVVLTGLTRRLDAAQSVELTLTFARAGRTTVLAIVEPAPGVLPRGPVVDFRVAPHDDALPQPAPPVGPADRSTALHATGNRVGPLFADRGPPPCS